jgi:hypothetical protein
VVLAGLYLGHYRHIRKLHRYIARVDAFLLRLARYPRINDPKLTGRMNAQTNHVVARSAALHRFTEEAEALVGDFEGENVRDPRNPGQEQRG